MTSYDGKDITKIRKQVIEMVFALLGEAYPDNEGLFDQMRMEIGLPVSELAANAVEHGENAQYEISEKPECILLVVQNQRMKNEEKKEEGLGGRGIFLCEEYPEIAKPNIKTKVTEDYYEVDIEFNLATIRANIAQLTKAV
ncbi:hypothetical protein COZ97_00340 [bacterium CG_4_8_14_3_um_filter_33_28]|nr:MAG: hypothetical protein COZ97_00340 [bacterium CG_4_8_14_3_um_filter_33_28]